MDSLSIDEPGERRSNAKTGACRKRRRADRNLPYETVLHGNSYWSAIDENRQHAFWSALVHLLNVASHTTRLLHHRRRATDLKISHSEAREHGSAFDAAT